MVGPLLGRNTHFRLNLLCLSALRLSVGSQRVGLLQSSEVSSSEFWLGTEWVAFAFFFECQWYNLLV